MNQRAEQFLLVGSAFGIGALSTLLFTKTSGKKLNLKLRRAAVTARKFYTNPLPDLYEATEELTLSEKDIPFE